MSRPRTDPELLNYLELAERRLQLVQALAREVSESNAAMAGLDVTKIEKSTLGQESSCAELACVASEIAELEPCIRNSAKNCDFERKRLLLEQATCGAAQELMYATRVHAALLRRSRRSIDMLMNVLSTCTAEYLTSSSAYPAARYF